MARFPDAREAVTRILGDLVTMYDRLPNDLHDRLPAGHAYRVGGTATATERIDRITVEIHASAFDPGTQAGDIGEAVMARLAHRYHDVPDVGLIDDVTVESVPADVPYPDPDVAHNVATYRLTSRAI